MIPDSVNAQRRTPTPEPRDSKGQSTSETSSLPREVSISARNGSEMLESLSEGVELPMSLTFTIDRPPALRDGSALVELAFTNVAVEPLEQP